VHRYSPDSLRAAWWTARAVTLVRRGRRRSDFGAGRIPSPPAVDTAAVHTVRAVLRRRSATCLVEAVVLQSWYAAYGERRDLIVGVTSPAAGFGAHAWIDGDQPDQGGPFVELLRRPPCQPWLTRRQ
jgi:Transglutaminase-like superfamily